MKESSIHQHFSQLTDPRIERTKKHPLINIIFIAFCAVLCGAEDWCSIEKFGKLRFKLFKQFLDLSAGIPSHDTFSRVFSLLDTTQFKQCFMSWVAPLATKSKKVIAIDGKTLRATKDKVRDLGALHLVNVWCCENQLVLGQQAVTDKSNEIKAIPLLLDLLDMSGAVITTDAMGTQKEISAKIREKEADYVLALKGNHSNLHDDVRLYFESLHNEELKLQPTLYHHRTLEKDHGRIEERNYWTITLPNGLHSEGWTDLKSIAMVRSTRTILGVNEETSNEDRFFISSLEAKKIKDIAQAVRQHWQVENGLHWCLDVGFNEDAWRSKLGNAAENMALVNKMALNLLKKETTAKAGIKNKRLMAGWDENYLTKVIMSNLSSRASPSNCLSTMTSRHCARWAALRRH